MEENKRDGILVKAREAKKNLKWWKQKKNNVIQLRHNQSNGKNKLSSEETLKLCLSLNIIRDKFELLLKNLGKESPCSSYDSVKKLLKQPATGAYKYKEFEDVRGLYVPDVKAIIMERINDLLRVGN
uniref:RNA-directed DNA polymerase, eukaryota, reverse transcriptase zinc-binding domain protein n=1 Tax=Strongyloides papillosus TaxID=174720 RepID=A0A0N5BD09_STREA